MTAVKHPTGTYLLYTHTVANQENHVFDFTDRHLVHGDGGIRSLYGILIVVAELIVGIFGQVAALILLCKGTYSLAQSQCNNEQAFHILFGKEFKMYVPGICGAGYGLGLARS